MATWKERSLRAAMSLEHVPLVAKAPKQERLPYGIAPCRPWDMHYTAKAMREAWEKIAKREAAEHGKGGAVE